jgi:hypothetical protein
MAVATKTNRVQVFFEKARRAIGGPSGSVRFKDEPQWRERLVRRLDSRSGSACKLIIFAPIETVSAAGFDDLTCGDGGEKC